MNERAIESLWPNPKNPRVDPRAEGFDELVASIRAQGVLTPLLIRQDGMILAGHRRYEAAKVLELNEVPVRVLSDEVEEGNHDLICLIENLLRVDLTVFEVAEYLLSLQRSHDFTLVELSNLTGITTSTISGYLRVAAAPQPLRDVIAADRLAFGAALDLLRADDPELIDEIVNNPEEFTRPQIKEIIRERQAVSPRVTVHTDSNHPPFLRDMIARIEDMDESLDRFAEYRSVQALLRQAASVLIDKAMEKKRAEQAKDKAQDFSEATA